MRDIARSLIGLSMLFNAGAAFAGDSIEVDMSSIKIWDKHAPQIMNFDGGREKNEISTLHFKPLETSPSDTMPAYTCIDDNHNGKIDPTEDIQPQGGNNYRMVMMQFGDESRPHWLSPEALTEKYIANFVFH